MRTIQSIKTVTILLATAIVLVACSSTRPNQPIPTDTSLSQSNTPKVEKDITKTPATNELTTKLQWDVEIVQNGKNVTGQNGEFKLHKEPFVIRVKLSRPMTVLLNAFDRDDNFKKIQPGSYADDDCEHGIHPFCSFLGMGFIAEPASNEGESLYIDEDGHHILPYEGGNEHRWNKIEISDKGAVFDRNVSHLLLIGPCFAQIELRQNRPEIN